MRIAIICHTAGLAGAELAIAESIQAMREAGHEVYVVVPEEGPFLSHVDGHLSGHRIIYQDHWTGVAHLTLWQKVKFLRGYMRAGRAISAYLKEIGADVVVTNTSTIVAGALGAAWAGVPHLWYVHEFVVEDHGLVWQYGQGFSYRVMNWLSKAIVVNSLAVKAKLARYIPEAKLHLAYCATEIDWPPLETTELPAAPILLMAGALSEGKNQALAVRALAEPELAALRAKLCIVGSGPATERRRLIDLAESLGVAERVEILPFNADRRAVFGLGRVLVVASRAEAFGRVTVEAQKSGLAVLVADAGAAREVVEDGLTGLLFEPGSASGLAQAAARLFKEPDLYENVRRQGLAEASRRFSLQAHWTQLRAALAAATTRHAG